MKLWRALFLFNVAYLAAQTRPQIHVAPPESLIDEPIRIRLQGLAPDETFKMIASTVDTSGRRWSSEATLRSHRDGTFDFSTDPSSGPGYDGVEPMGLLWSMNPDDKQYRSFARAAMGHHEVALDLMSQNAQKLATATIRRYYAAPDVKVQELREDGLVGRLYEPATVGRYPAVLVLGGSEGGIPFRYAPLLASRGYVALALAYYYIDPLPKALSEIPLEYVERGVSWLKHHRSVDPDRVGLIGISKGAELSLLLAAMHPRWFQAVVAISPSSVVWEAVIRNPTPDPSAFVTRNRSSWSHGGQPLPFLHRILTPETRSRMEKEGAADAIEVYSPALDDALTLERARIRVEEIKAPVLLVASKADRVWPSAQMAAQVQQTMRSRDLPCETLIYEQSSHSIYDSWLPPSYGTAPSARGTWVRVSAGGTAAGTAHATIESWQKVKSFFGQHLKH